MQVQMVTNSNGRDLIKEFLLSLAPKERAACLKSIELLQIFGFALSSKYLKKISTSPILWEVRAKQQCSYRVICTYSNNTMYLLNAFTKKTNKTPKKEIQLAIKRMQAL